MTLNLPGEVVKDSDVAGWERFEGHAEIGGQNIAYMLYVDPRYQALYRLTRYRVTVVTPTAEGRDVRSLEDEKLVWNSLPGSREPLHCYTLPQAIPGHQDWQTVPSTSEDYRTAMRTVIRLYVYHRSRRDAVVP